MNPRPGQHNLLTWNEPPTPLARRLCVAAMFSLNPRAPDAGVRLEPASRDAAAALDDALHAGSIAFVSGPSGAGKSSVLRALARRIRTRGARAQLVKPAAALRREQRAVLDLFGRPLHDDIRLLCMVGLAEAPLWLRPACVLSEGQRWRLSLALSVHAAIADGRETTLIADEFASTLDRVSAMTLCAGVNRLMRANRSLRLVAASAHDDIAPWLNADLSMLIAPAFARHGRHELKARKAAP